MNIHHLNCISTCPIGGRLMDGSDLSIFRRGRLTCHCLLVELGARLVLVDTGFGTRDVSDPASRLSGFFLTMVKPEFREELTAVRQVERLGFSPRDVTDIVLTHLDFDHAGGLDDFPWAKVHLLAAERDSAMAQKTWLDRQRFRPQQWSTSSNWIVYSADAGERWFGFERVRALDGLPPEIVFVPLIGHTFGHAGVAIDRGGEWLFDAGDAYFFHREMDARRPYCTPGLRFYQWMMEKDRKARLMNQERLRALKRARGSEVDLFCSHDVGDFTRLARRSPEVPTEALMGIARSRFEGAQFPGADERERNVTTRR